MIIFSSKLCTYECTYVNDEIFLLLKVKSKLHKLKTTECACVPHPKPPSHLPPYPIPQGCPSAPALNALFHASNLDW